jgi:hypothetical protein
LLVFAAKNVASEQWYLSNAAGMVLEYTPSQIVALRNKYALSITIVSPEELPEYLREYFKPSYQIELHILYEQGKESKRQWIFKDSGKVTRLVSSLNNPNVSTAVTTEEALTLEEEPPAQDPGVTPTGTSPIGFIEIYNEHNLIIEEHQFSADGAESIASYFYNKQILIKAETRLKTPGPTEAEGTSNEPVITLIATDNYRYNRSNGLRGVERLYHEAAADNSGEKQLTRLQFPHLGLNSRVDEQFVTPSTPYTSDFLQDIIMETSINPGDRVIYTTDERGKVLTETRQDPEGAIRGEIRNVWVGDRLESIEWNSGEDERRTEYDYDPAGNRIIERNYNKGVLERTVRRENDQEIEELYMNGAVILRAVWEKGRKISEERIRSSKPADPE